MSKLKHTGIVFTEGKAKRAPKPKTSETVIGAIVPSRYNNKGDVNFHVTGASWAELIANEERGESLKKDDRLLYYTLKSIFERHGGATVLIKYVYIDTKAPDKENIDKIIKASEDFKQPALFIDANNQRPYESTTPNILIAPTIDVEPVVEALATVGEQIGAFVYAAATRQGDYESFVKGKSEPYTDTFLDSYNDLNTRVIEHKEEPFSYWEEKVFGYAQRLREKGIRNVILVAQNGFYELNLNDSLVMTACVAGLRSYIDATDPDGFARVTSNVPMVGNMGYGLGEVKVPFNLVQLNDGKPHVDDLMDKLNQAGIMSLAYVEKSWRFIGNRTVSDDPDWIFENYVRIAFEIRKIISQSYLWALSKNIKGAGLPTDIVNFAKGILINMQASGKIIDFDVWVEEAENSLDSLEQGTFNIKFDFTAPPPLETLGITQIKTPKYLQKVQDSIAFLYPKA